jgi:hypothetical protein
MKNVAYKFKITTYHEQNASRLFNICNKRRKIKGTNDLFGIDQLLSFFFKKFCENVDN